MAIIVAPLLVFGGYFTAILAIILLAGGVYEFLHIKRKANMEPIPIFYYIISYIFAFFFIFGLPINGNSFDYKDAMMLGIINNYDLIYLISFLLITLAMPVFSKKVNIMDAVYTFTTTLYLSFGVKGLLYVRSLGGVDNSKYGLFMVLYLLIVTCFTDIFAYFGGMLCYKILGEDKVHKLNERISAKKTIEGTIIGTLFATVSGFIFGYFLINSIDGVNHSWYFYLLTSFILSLAGQLGDLILSANKRYYGIKDYSNLLPGHGGILDRIDSLIANSMMFAIIIFTFI